MRVGVFGLGYTGVRIAEKLRSVAGIELETFSAKTKISGTRIFDFSNASSLREFEAQFSKQSIDLCIVTFPIQKLSDRRAFLDLLDSVTERRILLGTTSIYARVPDIIETTPLIPDHERFVAEEEWLSHGGKILRLSGIYGPGRNPADWIRKGLVTKSSRQLNLIHGDDVAETVSLLISKIQTEGWDRIPKILNLSDNQWHTWKEIFSFLEGHGKIAEAPIRESEREDCFIDSELISNLLPDLQRKDFWAELENLEGISD
ncbi:hypothetical protein [Leptospira yasudae]|uniref:NAD(P)-dependent oxidoreductase n=1 Tax=Leptospira yasudae TaxID=2202201 RepID=A0A6N4QWY6_9LEPT|nr:hypothetical protein [Leptospira yasudae]TGL76077.1 hypothetical protein EHQ72_14360 [Leptospira yasudae]TGL83543.1 hypothetical protein EHQ77_01795 [Leptospira yasudae]TGL85447.1 hypothetical protein EHQ83_08130 [Leptospira yasudae]